MKEILRKAFSPILENFEKGSEDYVYKKSHRIVLIVMGIMFAILAAAVAAMAADADSMGYYIPVVTFGLVSLVILIVGVLGNERAVSSIWGNKP
jgi:hypothetical protein|tara:strand:- start:40612 stop:40893 length:282 start_codon:yes stop_codon:yes gene_type:complete